MNKLCCLIIMFITWGVCKSQNLVPNGDFEQYTGCPNMQNQLDSVLFWINPTTAGSPDFYHVCCPNTLVGIPYHASGGGWQYPQSGDSYVGIFIYRDFTGGQFDNIREYIETQLTSPLVAGSCYYFEMYINLSNNCNFNSDDIGVYFSDTAITEYTSAVDSLLLPMTAHINNPVGNFPDTLNWTLVSGNYTAQGGENFLFIGNFKHDSITTVTVVNSNISAYDYAYFYIEDVSLTICTAIEEQNHTAEINIYPNPFNGKLNFKVKNNGQVEIILYDIASRKLLQQEFTNSVALNTQKFAKGIYLYEVRNKNGVIKKGKVVKE